MDAALRGGYVGRVPDERPSWFRRRLVKPHYVLRPSQALRRISQRGQVPAEHTSRLPWGAEITYDAREAVGSSIYRTGVFELAVTEALLRLADPGELALDVGGNLGYMASALAAAVGPDGHVVTFEPHPALLPRLNANAARWGVRVEPVALADRSGIGWLMEPAGFERNEGVATLAEEGIEIHLATLDELMPSETVGVMKIDVEGNEEAVLRGAKQMLAERRVRDIVFEQDAPAPTPSTELLAEAGYDLFTVSQQGWRLSLGTLDRAGEQGLWDAPTCLATLDPDRARQRLGRRGWRALRDR